MRGHGRDFQEFGVKVSEEKCGKNKNTL